MNRTVNKAMIKDETTFTDIVLGAAFAFVLGILTCAWTTLAIWFILKVL